VLYDVFGVFFSIRDVGSLYGLRLDTSYTSAYAVLPLCCVVGAKVDLSNCNPKILSIIELEITSPCKLQICLCALFDHTKALIGGL
jgi:hypothetical protein